MLARFIPDGFDRKVYQDPKTIKARLAQLGPGVLFILDVNLYVKLSSMSKLHHNLKAESKQRVLLVGTWDEHEHEWIRSNLLGVQTMPAITEVNVPYPQIL